MRFHFDPKQKHQLDAIDAVLRVFEGQPASGGNEAFRQVAPGEAFAESEKNKIKCGQAHYEILDNVEFKQVSEVRELDRYPNYRQEDGGKNSSGRRGSGI